MISKNKQVIHERMLRVAAELSALSDVPRHKFGAVLVNNKTIISSGHNARKTHPGQYKWNQLRDAGKKERSWVHSEVSCLSKIRWVPKGSVLYITRVGADGNFLMARPCEGCMERVRQVKIETIIYTTPDGYAVESIRW
jgi:deoxycytidylate deaminase